MNPRACNLLELMNQFSINVQIHETELRSHPVGRRFSPPSLSASWKFMFRLILYFFIISDTWMLPWRPLTIKFTVRWTERVNIYYTNQIKQLWERSTRLCSVRLLTWHANFQNSLRWSYNKKIDFLCKVYASECWYTYTEVLELFQVLEVSIASSN